MKSFSLFLFGAKHSKGLSTFQPQNQYDGETDTEYFIPVGILFQMETEDKMNLHFINTDSFSAFCGMQATLEGIWIGIARTFTCAAFLTHRNCVALLLIVAGPSGRHSNFIAARL